MGHWTPRCSSLLWFLSSAHPFTALLSPCPRFVECAGPHPFSRERWAGEAAWKQQGSAQHCQLAWSAGPAPAPSAALAKLVPRGGNSTPGAASSPRTQGQGPGERPWLVRDGAPFGVAPTSRWSFLAAPLWPVPKLWLGWAQLCCHSSDFSLLGSECCWAHGPPLCHPIEFEKTDPFLHLLVEGSSMVKLEDRRLGL